MASPGVALLIGVFLSMSNVEAHYQDLTHLLDMEHISIHPIYQTPEFRYNLSVGHAGPYKDIPWVAFNRISMVEHTGTHLDVPYHTTKDGNKLDTFSLEDLHGPLVRIDISEKVKTNSLSLVTVNDLKAWEDKYGKIPDKAFVLMHSGWGKRFGSDNYLNKDPSDPDSAHEWPGFGREAVQWLLDERNVRGIGTDTISCDAPCHDYPAHILILGAGKLCVENLANLDKVPNNGAHMALMPLNIKGGTGSPLRTFAVWGVDFALVGTANLLSINLTFIMSMVFVTFLIATSH